MARFSLGTWARMMRSREGVAALEFAIILPVMLLLVMGGFEYSRVLAVSRKVTITTRALADLTTHYSSMTDADLATVMAASAQVFAPYSTTPMQITVSEVYVSAAGIATVVWSKATNTTALTPTQIVFLPAGIAQPNSYIVWTQVTYVYTPVVPYALTQNLTMADQLFMTPRRSASIAYQPS